MSRSRWPVILLPVLLLPLVVACGGDDDADDATPTTTTSAPPATTTTTAPAPAAGPEEWVEVVRDLYARTADLLADPNPDAVSSVFAESCPCYDVRLGNVEEIADAGWHIEGEPTTVLGVGLPATQPAGGFVRLTVRRQFQSDQVVDAAGEVVQEIPAADGPSCDSLLLLADGAGGAYRVHDEFGLTGCPGLGE